MSDERLQILKMLEEGKITAEEASKLLEALKTAEAKNSGQVQAAWEGPRRAKWMRIEVDERNGNRVRIKVPVVIIRAALRLGGHFNLGGFDMDELEPGIMETLEAAMAEGETGLLVDVVEEDGDHVKIYLE